MSIINTTDACTPPLLDQSRFGTTGGYQSGRYCGLGAFEDGTTCCFPCPVQDWIYSPDWQTHVRIPNYLSILSVILCSFLLISFLVLPPTQSHRHYLSVGLVIPVLFISLSFVIPVANNPPLCYDAITPNDMENSLSCAFTGSLVTLGGLGCVIWVFLRSLWLHIRIVWDRAPGKLFKWGSILVGTLLPLVFLVALLAATGFSYRMGQTCLPNHEHAIVTFWAWLIAFAIMGFVLQIGTTGYCMWIYVRALKREKMRRQIREQNPYQSTFNAGDAQLDTWKNVKKLFMLQWRNVLVSVFVLIGGVAFFVVFWTQDTKLGSIANDPDNIKEVKMWIVCQTLSRGDKEECRKYVEDFTVSEAAVVTSLILASLVGIEIFILLFRPSMLRAWVDLLHSIPHRVRLKRFYSPTPTLTTFGHPPKDTKSTVSQHSPTKSDTVELLPRQTSQISPSIIPSPLQPQPRSSSFESSSPRSLSPAESPIITTPAPTQPTSFIPTRTAPFPPQHPSVLQREQTSLRNPLSTPKKDLKHTYSHFSSPHPIRTSTSTTPSTTPIPPPSPSPSPYKLPTSSPPPTRPLPLPGSPSLFTQRTNSSKVRQPRISNPVPGSFVHRGGAGAGGLP
ncbi:hypothetical protein B0J11DRAFT_589264 [Dendryphion nanum]|uniref:G-protein coupled receptors family 2 profile 2 domain-containing protein n=1 Tax=Dendryphion nanum TaxID=256645 RepID=A0A9P9J303_9PLEO|nr:hypothetical protein B0J11DRAFT_589264 [Dendryphion nanum]